MQIYTFCIILYKTNALLYVNTVKQPRPLTDTQIYLLQHKDFKHSHNTEEWRGYSNKDSPKQTLHTTQSISITSGLLIYANDMQSHCSWSVASCISSTTAKLSETSTSWIHLPLQTAQRSLNYTFLTSTTAFLSTKKERPIDGPVFFYLFWPWFHPVTLLSDGIVLYVWERCVVQLSERHKGLLGVSWETTALLMNNTQPHTNTQRPKKPQVIHKNRWSLSKTHPDHTASWNLTK